MRNRTFHFRRIKTKQMTGKEIYEFTEKKLGFKITTKTRKRKYVEARSIANKLCRELTTDSFPKIAIYCNKNHASIIHSIRMFEDVYYPQIPEFREKYNNVKHLIEVERELKKELI